MDTQTLGHSHIVIIGAGLSGLNAARLLVAQGYSVTILEAHDRMGGRVMDLKEEGNLEPMGPEFIHGELPLTLQILKHYGIETEEQTGDFVTAKGEEKVDEEEDEDRYDSQLLEEAMKSLPEDMPLEAFLQQFLRNHPGQELVAEQARSYARGYFAADPNDFSTFALREDWLDEHPEGGQKIDYEPQFRPKGGYSALVEAMHRDLEGHAEVLLSCPVEAIHWSKGHADVFYRTRKGDRKRLPCQAVVVSVPVGVLVREAGVGAIHFEPTLPEKRQAARDIGTGPVLKVRLDFERPFWKEAEDLDDMGFLLCPGQPIGAFWTESPHDTATLTAWAAGPAARPFSGTDEEQVLNACMDSLAAGTDLPAEDIWDALGSFTLAYWGNDPFLPEAYTYDKAGLWDARTRLSKPVEDTLFFAGEATIRARYGGTVEAALEAGMRAALQVSSALPPTQHL